MSKPACKLIVWRVTASEIGPNDCGAIFFASREEADAHIEEYRKDHPDRADGLVPDKIEVNTRSDLARELNDAMGYGGA